MLERKICNDKLPSYLLLEELKVCNQNTITSVNVKSYADDIMASYKARRMNQIINSLRITPDNVEALIGQLMNDLEALKSNKDNPAKSLSQIAAEFEGMYFKERTVPLVNLGFDKLDDRLGGLEGGDLIIIGAGPAGLSAALYAKRGNLKTLIIEKSTPGGQLVNITHLNNYPGFKDNDGPTLAYIMYEQVNELNVEFDFSNMLCGYNSNQVFDYDEYVAIEHIIEEHKDEFSSDVDIYRLFNDVKSKLVDDYVQCNLDVNNIYYIPYPNIGNDCDVLKVVTLPNSKDILTMFPVSNSKIYFEEDLDDNSSLTLRRVK